MAVGYFVEAMARDTDKAHEEQLIKLRDQALQEFMDLACFANLRGEEQDWLN